MFDVSNYEVIKWVLMHTRVCWFELVFQLSTISSSVAYSVVGQILDQTEDDGSGVLYLYCTYSCLDVSEDSRMVTVAGQGS